MKKNLYLILVVVLLVFNIISCCGDIPSQDYRESKRGSGIYFDNYYDWCMIRDKNDLYTQVEPNGEINIIDRKNDIEYDDVENPHNVIAYVILNGSGGIFASSEWKDWQSEEGKLLHSYVDNNKINDDFQGKYKIYIYDDKYIYIIFNDINNTVIMFQTFYGEWVYDNDNNKWTFNESLWEKEEKENEFSYSCWLRKRVGMHGDFADGCSDSNRARITIKKLENTDSDNMFGYTLNIQGKNIIDCKMYNYKYKSPNAETNASTTEECIKKVQQYTWGISYFSRLDKIGNGIYISIFERLGLTFPCLDQEMDLHYGQCPSFFYDMSIREIDEENKTISINIIDEDNCAFADYFTYTYNKDNNKRVINYYKIIDGVPHLVKTIKGDNNNRIFFITNFEEEYRLEHHSLYGKEKNEQGI